MLETIVSINRRLSRQSTLDSSYELTGAKKIPDLAEDPFIRLNVDPMIAAFDQTQPGFGNSLGNKL
jgi:hypothetical protein